MKKKQPRKKPKKQTLLETERLVQLAYRLRRDCPWDREQTHQSLTRYLLEEAYESLEAIEAESPDRMREELGDLLFQVVLHSVLASEKNWFDFEAVSRGITEKLIHRHPFIFEKKKKVDVETQLNAWSIQKSKEKTRKHLLEGIPKALPALTLAQRYGEVAASVGFDWPDVVSVLKKVDEELEEFRSELRPGKMDDKARARAEMEMGDLLFTLTRVCGHLKLDAERALRRSSLKFEDRFRRLESKIKSSKKGWNDYSLDELEAEWRRIKGSGEPIVP